MFLVKVLFSIIFTFTYSIGIPPNQPLLQTPGVGHGDWYSDYAKGFDQHQKMLQLQASASQAGHGKKLTYFEKTRSLKCYKKFEILSITIYFRVRISCFLRVEPTP